MTATQPPLLSNVLRATRVGRGWSQDQLARVLRDHFGVPSASKRTIQRWEKGVIPNRENISAVMAALGIANVSLGPPRVVDDATGARHVRATTAFTEPEPNPDAPPTDGRLPGIWLLRYQYYSTGRDAVFYSQYHVLVDQRHNALQATSLPRDTAPSITMDLTIDGAYATGTWEERTDPAGHYLGDRRWGALQLRISPTRRWMGGLWVGWGSGERINSGPWELLWITGVTNPDTIAGYSRVLPDEPV